MAGQLFGSSWQWTMAEGVGILNSILFLSTILIGTEERVAKI
jgi:hypothetical protein